MRRLSALLLLSLVAGCDGFSGEEQRLFEDTAFGTVSNGVTADDWRVGPAFGARMQVLQAATPNPARLDENVAVQVYADEAAGGLALYRRQPDGGLQLIQARSGVSGPNIYTFTFFGSEASATGGAGSSRLLVLDGVERVVTYGDLVLQ